MSGRRVFESLHELERLRRAGEPAWDHVDLLVVPTVPEPWLICEAMARPLESSAACGARLQRAAAGRVPVLERPARIALAVLGAHLAGMPLHHQLTSLDARLLARTSTSADYRLYSLADTTPPKPGLRRVETGGSPIEVEVYALAPDAFGRFVAAVPRPLAIGRIALEDGSDVSGFVCEPEGLEGAEDITSFGGWRAWCSR